jgi:hypothetical protein
VSETEKKASTDRKRKINREREKDILKFLLKTGKNLIT